MIWTTEKPSKPGWYWWREIPHHRKGVVEIVSVHGRIEACEDWWPWDSCELNGQWAGPIPEPEEQP